MKYRPTPAARMLALLDLPQVHPGYITLSDIQRSLRYRSHTRIRYVAELAVRHGLFRYGIEAGIPVFHITPRGYTVRCIWRRHLSLIRRDGYFRYEPLPPPPRQNSRAVAAWRRWRPLIVRKKGDRGR